MWIKLHLYYSGDEVSVQTQNICAVYPDQRKGWGKCDTVLRNVKNCKKWEKREYE